MRHATLFGIFGLVLGIMAAPTVQAASSSIEEQLTELREQHEVLQQQADELSRSHENYAPLRSQISSIREAIVRVENRNAPVHEQRVARERYGIATEYVSGGPTTGSTASADIWTRVDDYDLIDLSHGMQTGPDETYGYWVDAFYKEGAGPVGIDTVDRLAVDEGNLDIESVIDRDAFSGVKGPVNGRSKITSEFTLLTDSTIKHGDIQITDDPQKRLDADLRIRFPVHGRLHEKVRSMASSSTSLIPEPTTLALLGFGGLAMMPRRRRI